MTRWVAGILIAGSLTALVWAQAPTAPAGPTWANGEDLLGLPAGNEKDPIKKLDLLKKWEQQYPNSALKNQRTLMTAQTLLAILGAAYNKPAGDPALAPGQKAGQQLLDHFNEYFDDSVKPAALPADQWVTAKKTSELQAHLILAYIAQVQKDYPTAEAEDKKILTLDPTQAATSYQLGSLILSEMAKTQDLTRYSEALYNFARSLSVTGPTALPPQGKTAAENALKKNYSNYHGSVEGQDDLIKQTSASALPPPGFHILSVVELQEIKDKDHAAWAAAHPDLDFWETVKAALTTQGDAFFATLKDVGLPPPASDAYKGPAMFKGTVVSVPSTKTMLVNVDNVVGDATLKFDDNIKGDIPAGTAIQFKGVVDSYTKDPYAVTLVVQEPKADIVGLPDGVKFVPDAAAKPKPTKAAPKAVKKAAQ